MTNRSFQAFLEDLTQFIDEELWEAWEDTSFVFGDEKDYMETVIRKLQESIEKKRLGLSSENK